MYFDSKEACCLLTYSEIVTDPAEMYYYKVASDFKAVPCQIVIY